MDDSTPDPTDTSQISRRANELMLKLLEGIERDIANRLLPSQHMKAYEALCRAERIRRGY